MKILHWVWTSDNIYETSKKSREEASEDFKKYCTDKLGLLDINGCITKAVHYYTGTSWKFEISSEIYYENLRYQEQEYKRIVQYAYNNLNPQHKKLYLDNRVTLDDFDTEI